MLQKKKTVMGTDQDFDHLGNPKPPRARQFYRWYLVDHYLYKQELLIKAIEQHEELKNTLLEDVEDVDEEEYLTSLKIDVRLTYFLSVETLFELIYALRPRKGGIDNTNIWLYLSESGSDRSKYYDWVADIAQGDLTYFDQEVTATEEGDVVSLDRYLFYFGDYPEWSNKIEESLEAIRDILRVLALERYDREQFHHIKHSLRLFPMMEKVEAFKPEDEEKILEIDMSDMVTQLRLEEDSVEKKLLLRSTPLDYKRDYRMTLLCSRLISNIIRTRRIVLLDDDEEEPIYFFDEEEFSEVKESDSDVGEIQFGTGYRRPLSDSNDG